MIRTSLLSQYNKAIIYLGLAFGVLGNLAAASFMLECIENMRYGDYPLEFSLALSLQVASIFYILMHLLLFLGGKSAIRMAMAGLVAIVCLVIFLLLVSDLYALILPFLLYVPFYNELFKIKKSWETAVSHDSAVL